MSLTREERIERARSSCDGKVDAEDVLALLDALAEMDDLRAEVETLRAACEGALPVVEALVSMGDPPDEEDVAVLADLRDALGIDDAIERGSR
jgi:hypothetical protein